MQRLRAAAERDVVRQGCRPPEQAARERRHGAQDVGIRGRVAEGGTGQPQDAPRVRAAAHEVVKAEVRQRARDARAVGVRRGERGAQLRAQGLLGALGSAAMSQRTSVRGTAALTP